MIDLILKIFCGLIAIPYWIFFQIRSQLYIYIITRDGGGWRSTDD